MILSKNTIEGKLRTAEPLFTNYDGTGLCNSSYKVRIGKIVVPRTGLIIDKSRKVERLSSWGQIRYFVAKLIAPQKCLLSDKDNVSGSFILKPREIVLFETAEKIKLPNDLMGSYSGLNTISQKGILLINASIIEPGYKGPLSGILVNFSSKNIKLAIGMQIAKICFHQLDNVVEKAEDSIGEAEYTKMLKNLAKENYTETFLDIKTILNEVEIKMTNKIKREACLAGLLVAILLFIGTLEPFIYNAVWGHTSVSEWQKMNDTENVDSLKKQLNNLTIEIDRLKNAKK